MPQRELLPDRRADVAAVHAEPFVPERRHEAGQPVADPGGPRRLGGDVAPAVTRDARHDEVEVRREQRESVLEADDSVGPAVDEQQRRRARRAGPHGVDAHTVDLDAHVVERVQSSLGGPPVVRTRPMGEQTVERGGRGAAFPAVARGRRAARAREAVAQVVEHSLCDVDR